MDINMKTNTDMDMMNSFRYENDDDDDEEGEHDDDHNMFVIIITRMTRAPGG